MQTWSPVGSGFFISLTHSTSASPGFSTTIAFIFAIFWNEKQGNETDNKTRDRLSWHGLKPFLQLQNVSA